MRGQGQRDCQGLDISGLGPSTATANGSGPVSCVCLFLQFLAASFIWLHLVGWRGVAKDSQGLVTWVTVTQSTSNQERGGGAIVSCLDQSWVLPALVTQARVITYIRYVLFYVLLCWACSSIHVIVWVTTTDHGNTSLDNKPSAVITCYNSKFPTFSGLEILMRTIRAASGYFDLWY